MNRKEAIEIVRSNFPNGRIQLSEALKILIPELKESEDVIIRKEIISFLEGFYANKNKDRWIAWLERQDDKCLVNFDEAEQEKYDFVSGQFIECRKSFNEFREDNSYWLEYIGDDTYIGRSANILNKKFHITPRQLFTLFTQQHCPKEDNNVNEETNAPTEYGKYVDKCLDEAAKHFYLDGEDKYSVADLFHAGVRCGKSLLEKQSEQQYTNSKDDERLRKTTVAFLKDFAKQGYENAVECIDWLEKQGEQKSVKWSEEDKGFIDLLLAIFTNEHPNGLFTTGNIPVFNGNHVSSNRIVTWLKSIKSKNQTNIWYKISNSDFPQITGDYLVVCKNKNKEDGIYLYEVAYYTGDGWDNRTNWEDIIAWMELPKYV